MTGPISSSRVEMVHHLLTVTPADRTGVVAVLAGGSGRSLVFTRTKRAARAGAAGTVITLQTSAQAGAVPAIMRKARVVPLTATVTSESPLLRSIAGAPAPRVTLAARPGCRAKAVTVAPATGRGAAAFSAGFRGRGR